MTVAILSVSIRKPWSSTNSVCSGAQPRPRSAERNQGRGAARAPHRPLTRAAAGAGGARRRHSPRRPLCYAMLRAPAAPPGGRRRYGEIWGDMRLRPLLVVAAAVERAAQRVVVAHGHTLGAAVLHQAQVRLPKQRVGGQGPRARAAAHARARARAHGRSGGHAATLAATRAPAATERGQRAAGAGSGGGGGGGACVACAARDPSALLSKSIGAARP